MDVEKLDQTPEPEYSSRFDLDKAVEDAAAEEESGGGKLHISEEVLKDIAGRALTHVGSVVPASSGSSVLGLGRKGPDGVRISLVEEDRRPRISVDAYVLVRYGKRIPDVAWDLQEYLKNELEGCTGYEVKAVNIFVQGVYFGEQPQKDDGAAGEIENKAVPVSAGE